MNSSDDQPWWLLGVAVVLFAVGFYLEFTGKDGNSLPRAIIVLVGFLTMGAFWIVGIRRRRANR